MKSYNSSQNKDCFGNKCTEIKDHIWPKEKEGAKIGENIQYLCEKSNNTKREKFKGKIHNIRFSIEKKDENINGKIVIMYIKLPNKNGWYEVTSE